jgi:hypothetical protein
MQGKPWYAWEWLYDVGIAQVHRWAGLNGVVFFSALIIAVTFAVTFRFSLKRGGSIAGTLLTLLLAIGTATIHFLARPHLLSWLLMLIWFYLLDSFESNPTSGSKLLWLPAIMLLWVNLHGGFLVGFFLLGIYLLTNLWDFLWYRNPGQRTVSSKQFKRVALIGMLCALATLINPYGYKLHIHIYQYLSNHFLMGHISEFQSPNFHGIAEQCFVLLCLIAVVALVVTGMKPRPVDLLLVLFAVASGLYASRNLPSSAILLVLVIAPFLTKHSDEKADAEPKPTPQKISYFHALSFRMEALEKHLRGHLWPMLAVLGVLWICMHTGKLGAQQLMNASFSEERFPVYAADILERGHIAGPIFSPDEWGGYLIYRLYPGTKVVLDDRHDLYGEQFFKDYLKLIRLEPGWQEVLNNNLVNWVLMPAQSPLGGALSTDKDWAVEYRDKVAVLLHRKLEQPASSSSSLNFIRHLPAR